MSNIKESPVSQEGVSGPFSASDTYYDDYFSLVDAKRLTKIIGYSALVVDKLQFVYDDDPALTVMHGNGDGSYFEFVLEPDEFINSVTYLTANCSFYGYGDSPVLISITFATNKRSFQKGIYEKSYEALAEGFKNGFSNTREYAFAMDEGEELFCLAGVYDKYMGRITTIHTRIRSNPALQARSLLSAGRQENSNGKTFLCINHIKKKDAGRTLNDDSVLPLTEGFFDFYDQLSGEKQDKCALLPERSSASSPCSDLPLVEAQTAQRAILSGQYSYISIRCHGTSITCGNPYALLFDVEWVRDNAGKIGSRLSNTTFNFLCCECGYRGRGSYKGKSYSGLARELIAAGVKAVFAYTTILCSWPNPYQVSTLRPIFKRFVANADKQIIGNSKTPEAAAPLILKEYDALLKAAKDNCSLQQSSIDYLTDTLPKALASVHPNDFTAAGLTKTSVGAELLRGEVDRWSRQLASAPDAAGYRIYVDLFINKSHFCGPSIDGPTLRGDNLGELCQDFLQQTHHDL